MKIEQGQVVVVTGGASGIGFALARRFAREGLAIVLADVEARRSIAPAASCAPPAPRRRNRAAGPSEAGQLRRPGAAQLDQLMRFGMTTTGIDPAEVAEKVTAAVRDGRFWVLPHEGSVERVREVAARSYGEQNPVPALIAQPAGVVEPADR